MSDSATPSISFTRDDFRGPVEQLTGLPNLAYTSDDFACFERDAVLARTWLAVAHVAELGESGRVHPVEIGGIPLLITNDGAGNLSVFHNVCSHRGMKLVETSASSSGMIRCPYHSWCYRLDGSLLRTPHIRGEGQHEDPDFDCSNHGLHPVRHRIFAGLIFVNLSGDAPSFDDFIRPVVEHWSAFNFDDYRHGGEDSWWQIELQSNWKLAQENHVDGYHLPSVHPDLHAYSPLGDHYPLVISGRASGQGSRCQAHAGNIGAERLPHNPALGEDWQQGRAEFLSIFPNFMMGVHADHIWTVYLLPDAPDKTTERMDLSYFGKDSLDAGYAELRQANRDRMLAIFEEDRDMVEGMQRGRQSPAFTGGALAPAMDQPAYCFNRMVAEAVLETLD